MHKVCDKGPAPLYCIHKLVCMRNNESVVGVACEARVVYVYTDPSFVESDPLQDGALKI